MYYYGNNGYYGAQAAGYGYGAPYGSYAGYTAGTGLGGAIWIVLFILLIIILGAGFWGGGDRCCEGKR
jgi:hypothetical protein